MLGQVTVPEGDWRALNLLLGRLQQASLQLSGLKLDRTRTVMPSVAPGPQDPNVVLVDIAGVLTLVLWDGSAWVVVGTQT